MTQQFLFEWTEDDTPVKQSAANIQHIISHPFPTYHQMVTGLKTMNTQPVNSEQVTYALRYTEAIHALVKCAYENFTDFNTRNVSWEAIHSLDGDECDKMVKYVIEFSKTHLAAQGRLHCFFVPTISIRSTNEDQTYQQTTRELTENQAHDHTDHIKELIEQ